MIARFKADYLKKKYITGYKDKHHCTSYRKQTLDFSWSMNIINLHLIGDSAGEIAGAGTPG